MSGTTEVASQAIARQQQAELQTALGNWIVSASSEVSGLAGARIRYNETPNKLSLLTNYIQAATLQSFSNDGTEIRSDALTSSKARLYFSSSWTIGSTPTVTWSNLP